MSSTRFFLKREENALAWENPQPDVLVGEAEEGLQGRAGPEPGAFLVLCTVLLPLLSFLVDSDLVTGVHPCSFHTAHLHVRELYSNRGKNGSVCCCNKF